MAKIIRVWDGTQWQEVGTALPNALSTDGVQTLTNKTINLTSNTITGTTAQFNTALSDGNFATLAGTETLTNKTISGADNTITNIPNNALTNSSITINGSAISLGGSTTIAGGLAQPSEPSSPGDGQIWVDTDGSVVGQAMTRWSKIYSAGVTSISGLDDSSVTLTYTSGYEQVYRNGVLLSRGNDYTATTGTSITLIDATLANDVIEVIGSSVLGIADVYTQTQSNAAYIGKALVDAKGDIITATADDTPARLAVGANDTVLTADSSTSTGLKWATPSSGGMTLLSTTTLSGASSITISSISQSYNELHIYIYGVTNNTTYGVLFATAYNGASALTASGIRPTNVNAGYVQWSRSETSGFRLSDDAAGSFTRDRTNANNAWKIVFTDYASTSNYKSIHSFGTFFNLDGEQSAFTNMGGITSNSAINSIVVSNSGGTFSAGTVKIYGVK